MIHSSRLMTMGMEQLAMRQGKARHKGMVSAQRVGVSWALSSIWGVSRSMGSYSSMIGQLTECHAGHVGGRITIGFQSR